MSWFCSPTLHQVGLLFLRVNLCTMTYTKTGLCLLLGVILQSSCTNKDNSYQLIDIELVSLLKAQSPSGNLSYFELPSSTDLNKIPQDPKNTLTTSKIALGGFLFHETTLGTEGKEPALKQTYSCATCHHYDAGFQSGTLQGYGDGGTGFGVNGELRVIKSNISNPDVQSLRTLSVLNGAFQTNQMWNGQFGSTHVNANTKSLWTETSILKYNNLGFEGLETRSIAGLEMHRMKMTDDIIKMGAYKNLFDDAFQNIPENIRYTNETAGLAIAAYLRTITASEAPFQKYVQGNIDAMNESEKQGAIVFFGKGQCSSCHTGPALNSMQFNALGMNDMIDKMILLIWDGVALQKIHLTIINLKYPNCTTLQTVHFMATDRASGLLKKSLNIKIWPYRKIKIF